jgi:hypothetical protein
MILEDSRLLGGGADEAVITRGEKRKEGGTPFNVSRT